MAFPFVAEIRIFSFDFAPKNWALCNGQLLEISQNTALHSLLGTNYGGDGKKTFGLPNLQGRLPVHANGQPGGTGGSQTVKLTVGEMPTHRHVLNADTDDGASADPSGAFYRAGRTPGNPAHAVWAYNTGLGTSSYTTALNPSTVTTSGGDKEHNNMMPYLTMNYCIALAGVFPSRA